MIARLLLVLAALAGIAALVLPLGAYRSADGKLATRSSALRIIAERPPDPTPLAQGAHDLGLSKADAERLAHAVDQGTAAYRGLLIGVFVPGTLLVLLAFVVLARRQMGRTAGALAIVLGLASLAAFVVLLLLVGDLDVKDTAVTLKLEASRGAGVYCLAAAGLLAALGGAAAVRHVEF